ncbi:hypothetical protein TNIN_434841 [Trichonephila inaurata madagascariensis]|uniref:Uncharacterized protein n=1 Tax=Trichonephila inaurata madagascariensis TaxID=2747483 RepID=A0A8X6YX44_9ARAC|nr:hypothetical protein TNIN_434841 [Trichonephila inaurata madagascariensis]
MRIKGSTEGAELGKWTVADRVDLLGKVIPRRAIEDKLSKLVKHLSNLMGKVHALVVWREITVIKKNFVPGISVLKGFHDLFEKGFLVQRLNVL